LSLHDALPIYRIRRLAALVIIEVREADEVLPRPIELELPDMDVAGATIPARRLDLAVGFDACVLPVGKDPFDFIVRAGRTGEIRHRTGRQVDAHHGRQAARLVAGES